MKVLVTGGTGVLGREVASRLRERGAEVVVLSRRSGEGRLRGNLETGEGIAEALVGVDVVAHCARGADWSHPQRDVVQTRNLLAAAAALLLALGDSQGEAGVTELARRLGLHKSTASRLLATLQKRGLVEQDDETGKYLVVWENVGGEWKIVRDMWNGDAPMHMGEGAAEAAAAPEATAPEATAPAEEPPAE